MVETALIDSVPLSLLGLIILIVMVTSMGMLNVQGEGSAIESLLNVSASRVTQERDARGQPVPMNAQDMELVSTWKTSPSPQLGEITLRRLTNSR